MKKKQKKQLSSNFFQNKINNKLITLRLKKTFSKTIFYLASTTSVKNFVSGVGQKNQILGEL